MMHHMIYWRIVIELSSWFSVVKTCPKLLNWTNSVSLGAGLFVWPIAEITIQYMPYTVFLFRWTDWCCCVNLLRVWKDALLPPLCLVMTVMMMMTWTGWADVNFLNRVLKTSAWRLTTAGNNARQSLTGGNDVCVPGRSGLVGWDGSGNISVFTVIKDQGVTSCPKP